MTSTMAFSEIERVICFTPGTGVATPQGLRPVELLHPGDHVITRDNGIRTICWVGKKTLGAADTAQNPWLRPVLIRAGAFGDGIPETDIRVSPNHRMLLANQLAETMFGEREVLVPAKHLAGLPGVEWPRPAQGVTYVHVMFESHEVLLAGGTWSESFQPGGEALRGVGAAQRRELLALFPDLETEVGLGAYRSARISLRAHEARVLLAEIAS
ncbi:Hint domain-containing protein [Pseudohalocynthiibacter aestuariivivens]|nr:Hint domain-containing protein [Pseudohalocynthiibacter aestuariivivens]QIE44327.1 Hint domain-containing protein [Pseudohalocynthiibacter aestuariivivens]